MKTRRKFLYGTLGVLGSNALGGKGTTWEGGMRLPGIFCMPVTVQPGPISEMGSSLDQLRSLNVENDFKALLGE